MSPSAFLYSDIKDNHCCVFCGWGCHYYLGDRLILLLLLPKTPRVPRLLSLDMLLLVRTATHFSLIPLSISTLKSYSEWCPWNSWRSNANRDNSRFEMEQQARAERYADRQAEMQTRHEEIRRKYGVPKQRLHSFQITHFFQGHALTSINSWCHGHTTGNCSPAIVLILIHFFRVQLQTWTGNRNLIAHLNILILLLRFTGLKPSKSTYEYSESERILYIKQNIFNYLVLWTLTYQYLYIKIYVMYYTVQCTVLYLYCTRTCVGTLNVPIVKVKS